MKVLRTIFWVLTAAGFAIFAIYNWQPVELTLWQNLVLETKVPVLALLAFVLGFLPMWAVHRSVTWGLNRRIKALENSLKHTALARHHEPQTQAAAPAQPAAQPAAPVDSPVDKPGTKPGEPADPLSPTDTGPDTGPNSSPDTSIDGAAK